MKDQLQQRLQALQAEAEAGQKMLAEFEARRAQVCDTLNQIIEERIGSLSFDNRGAINCTLVSQRGRDESRPYR